MSNDAKEFQKQISNKLNEAFTFDRAGFSEPIQWIDGVGLSRVKEMPNDHASLYKIGILDREFQEESPKKQLHISVSYGKKVSEGISLGSEKQNLFGPIDFDNNDDFYFHIGTYRFFQKDKEITPDKLLSNLEELHIRPTKFGRGFYLRSKLWFWRIALPWFVKLIDSILRGILWLVAGEITAKDILHRFFDDSRTESYKSRIPDKVEIRREEPMDFFGYKAKRWSVIFYCALHLLIFATTYFYPVEVPFIKILFENNFTSLCYVVVTFALTEAGLPWLLKSLIEQMPRLYGNIAFMRLKF